MRKTKEEVAVMGVDAPISMTDDTIIVGKSGKRFQLVNFFTEFPARQRRYAFKYITPVLPIIMAAFKEGAARADALVNLDLGPLVAMLSAGGDFDLKFLASVYLPVDDRKWPDLPDSEIDEIISERAKEFDNWTIEQEVEILRGFFSLISASVSSISIT